jgi:hypothetical protein
LRLEAALEPAEPERTVAIPEPAVETRVPTASKPEASPQLAAKRGAKAITEEEACAVAEIVERVALDGDWLSKLDDVRYALDHGVCDAKNPDECDAEDHPKIALPRGWKDKKWDWFGADRAALVKAIKERLGRAKRARRKFSAEIPA